MADPYTEAVAFILSLFSGENSKISYLDLKEKKKELMKKDKKYICLTMTRRVIDDLLRDKSLIEVNNSELEITRQGILTRENAKQYV